MEKKFILKETLYCLYCYALIYFATVAGFEMCTHEIPCGLMLVTSVILTSIYIIYKNLDIMKTIIYLLVCLAVTLLVWINEPQNLLLTLLVVIFIVSVFSFNFLIIRSEKERNNGKNKQV